jgi:D-tagatose-1,6-bisphosphate aldolase subunit GatZ/KbaZ
MNKQVRNHAQAMGLPLMDYILLQIKQLEKETGIKRSIFAACPNSIAVIKAALKSAKRCNAPLKFAATLNQVDLDGGYTGMTQNDFVRTIREQARVYNVQVPVIIAIDHGGPWLKDKHSLENWPYIKTKEAVKKSFEAAIDAGYDLIHVDPTVDISIPKSQIISIETVVDRTIELIAHAEAFRKRRLISPISYEVGTEEVHGGLADLAVFNHFLQLLKEGLLKEGLAAVWPCFVVGKVGTDLHTTTFAPEIAKKLAGIAANYGSVIKGHYSDNVSNPEAYPESGMGGANVGPEFTELEYSGLMELIAIEEKLIKDGRLSNSTGLKKIIWKSVIDSGRWRKWLQKDESSEDFYKNSPNRQEWLIQTGCRYVWENPAVLEARAELYTNIEKNGIKASEIVESRIESSMDKYFHTFNLVGLNNLL